MRIFFSAVLFLLSTNSIAQTSKPAPASPLAVYSKEWNKTEYLACNTAKNVLYMTKKEKDVIYVLNLIRRYPQLFVETVLSKYPGFEESTAVGGIDYYKTLVDTLNDMDPLDLLVPDRKCYQSAYCHASSSGAIGFVGHERKTTACSARKYFNGECIDYGFSDALDIVLHLLIDEGIASLGHRYICLGDYTGLGVSIQPHTVYKYCCVMDFTYPK
jgi:hypothetical protein